MNPQRYIHTVSVQRASTTVVAGERAGTLATVVASMRCLIEPMSERQRDSVLGRVPTARYRITWGTEDVRNGDTVTWNGLAFIVEEIVDDTTRPNKPYHIATLSGKKR